jgi:imidazolonepropionase-like amidohydrolase
LLGLNAGIGFCRFERYADGLYVLADASYSPMEIIAAATESVAYACGLSSITGKVQPGFSADLVAFAGNPLEDTEAFFLSAQSDCSNRRSIRSEKSRYNFTLETCRLV